MSERTPGLVRWPARTGRQGMRLAQRGVVLISALIIMALATVVAAAIFFDTGLTGRRAIANFGMEQALLLAQGAEALAAQALRDDQNQTDTPGESWAQAVDPVEVDTGVVLEARLYDRSGRFNINSLVNADSTQNENAVKVFGRLLELKGLPRGCADMVVDWIDADTLPSPDGGEDGTYVSRMPPHRAANITITSTSELLQLPCFTAEAYELVRPHIVALPGSVRTINVCMADGIVLDALYGAHTSDIQHVEYSTLDPRELEERRAGSGCYPQRSVLTQGQQAMQQLTTERSSWFMLETWVTVGTAQFALYSLMQRENNQVRTVSRTLGSE